MNKYLRAVVCGLLLLALLAGFIAPVFAEDSDSPDLTISTAEDLLAFAENCVLDTYSENLTVSLEADIDLQDVDFSGIPIFCGTFNGNNHVITGLSLTKEGSVQGLFRYLTEQAVVENLSLQGTVSPDGTRCQVGGIAGCNAGTIRSCNFQGEVSGLECIGGVAGTNEVSGVIENCYISGSIHGTHFVGGAAGENYGLIRSCVNKAGINTTSTQNDVMVSDITTDTIMGTESANTVTDLGGIAGTTTGVIRDCENDGTVGYQHMGYNVGGIAGSQKGLIASCRNYGDVFGRKEVAGIAGQMEPVTYVEFSQDTLQILRGQLATTSSLANQASSNIHRSSRELSSQMSQLHTQADTAVDAVKQLVPTEENPHLPDEDSILAAKNTLSGSISSMQSTMSTINSTTVAGIGTAAGDIRAITGQIDAISNTLDHAAENVGGKVTDISDSDTPDDLTGKVMDCENFGTVSGDVNVGGVAGTVGWENDLDPEDDFQISGEKSLNFNSELRAVILSCRNSAEITAKKRNVGGIVGNLSMGLVRGSINTGLVDGESAQYVGGIAGFSDGFLRECSVRCELRGKLGVGGIAGSAPIASDCRSLVRLPEEGEQLGAVLGVFGESKDQENPIHGNVFLPVGPTGGIDGISYSGQAEPMERDEFLALENLPPIFENAEIRFVYENGSTETVTVPIGERLDQIPAVPQKDGCIGIWEDIEELDLEHIYFDMKFTPTYDSSRSVVESAEKRDDGRAVMLVEGEFTGEGEISLTSLSEFPETSEENKAVEGWSLPDFGSQQPKKLRLALPEDQKADTAEIMVQGADGTWRTAEVTVSGTYLVFEMQPQDRAVCLIQMPAVNQMQILVICGIGLAAVLVVGFGIRHHRRNRKRKAEKKDATDSKETKE